MTKSYGTKNKGFRKSNDNRRKNKLETLISKRVKHRRGEGPELTKSESEWLKKHWN